MVNIMTVCLESSKRLNTKSLAVEKLTFQSSLPEPKEAAQVSSVPNQNSTATGGQGRGSFGSLNCSMANSSAWFCFP
jgi:hypothetical protein